MDGTQNTITTVNILDCFLFQTEQAMELLIKVENISGPELELHDKYMAVLNTYAHDLEVVRKLYQRQKSDPIVPRNLPPISGKLVALSFSQNWCYLGYPLSSLCHIQELN